MQTITITALDTLCFRDGKPFTSGEDTWADTIFPPMPSVLYGILRGIYFAQPGQFAKANTPDDPTTALTIRGVALQCQKSSFFPLPFDCIVEKGKEDDRQAVLLNVQKPAGVSNCRVPTVRLPPAAIIGENKGGYLLSDAFLEQYLSGASAPLFCDKLNDYVLAEPKVGIGRDNDTRAAEEGKLYRIDMRRCEGEMKFAQNESAPLHLAVTFDQMTLPASGLTRLGGEGKAARYALSPANLVPPPTLTGNRFKLYLSTPAIFAQGWLPSWIDQETLEGTYQHPGLKSDLRLKLETAILGKPFGVGGFDMEKRQPKEMRKAVPAGSVYYFTLLQGSIDEAIAVFHNHSIADGANNQKQGFGLVLIGGIA